MELITQATMRLCQKSLASDMSQLHDGISSGWQIQPELLHQHLIEPLSAAAYNAATCATFLGVQYNSGDSISILPCKSVNPPAAGHLDHKAASC